MSKKSFTVTGQHYLFSVQAFAQAVLAAGGIEYDYAFRNGTTRQIIADVASGEVDLGVIFSTSQTAEALEAAFDEAGVEFHRLVDSTPYVAVPASHPLVNSTTLSLEDLADYPFIYFEQEDDDPAFAEEALADVPRAKRIGCTDRASLSELISALNGYTVTSGILVGVTDGTLLRTIPLETDVTITMGCLTKKGAELSETANHFVNSLRDKLVRYTQR